MTMQYFRGAGGAVIAVEDGMGMKSEHDEFYDKWLFEKEVEDGEDRTDSVSDSGDIVDPDRPYLGE